jgi:hypothetical protein
VVSEIPQAAIDALAGALHGEVCAGTTCATVLGDRQRDRAKRLLEAAAPHIRAAERERIAALAEQEAAHADLQAASEEARIVGAVLRNIAAGIRNLKEDPDGAQ